MSPSIHRPSSIQIRGLTLIEPMGWAIREGHKPIENRSWKPFSGITHVAIHSGKKYDAGYARQIESLGIEMPSQEEIGELSGHIIAIARLDGYVESYHAAVSVVGAAGAQWFSGPYGWILGDVRTTRRILHRGFPGMWRLHPAAEAECLKVLSA